MPWTKNGNIKGPPGAPTVYGSAGLTANPKMWSDTVTTTTGGAFTANISSAGFASVPRAHADAVSAGTALNQSASAVITGRTATAITGFVNVPVNAALGGSTMARAGAGIVVSILAIGT